VVHVRRLRLFTAVVTAVVAGSGAAVERAQAALPSPTKGVVIVSTNLAYQNASAAGTGIVLTSNGEILTNNHVIRGATTITVTVPTSKRKYNASVVGYDIVDDIALLKLGSANGLATVTRGNSANLRVGQAATAVGNANGAGKLVITKGRITGLDRSITVSGDGERTQLQGLIETSAALVPGDSGGPLLNAAGRVIGIDAAGSSGNAFEASDGYAIPINRAMGLVRLMRAGKGSAVVHVGKTGFLGISIDTRNDGAVIASVVSGGPGASAGLAVGEQILAIDGKSVSSLSDLRAALFQHHPGDSVAISYVDQLGNQGTATVVLGDGPPQ
jgi:S1-C subfamily serine protease